MLELYAVRLEKLMSTLYHANKLLNVRMFDNYKYIDRSLTFNIIVRNYLNR